MIKRYFTGALALLLIMAILSGCGTSEGKDSGEVDELTLRSPAPTDTSVFIRIRRF
jgi:hypothetical protein